MPPMDDPKKQPQNPRVVGNGGEFEGLGMDELLDIYDKKMASFNEGDIIRGRVIKITSTEVMIDIGYKSEGLLPVNEVTGYDGKVKVKPATRSMSTSSASRIPAATSSSRVRKQSACWSGTVSRRRSRQTRPSVAA